MKILSWNVAGIRALIKKESLNFLNNENYDIVCFQETKALEKEVNIPNWLKEKYPFRYWSENLGISQRKGLSGTCIWSKRQAKTIIKSQEEFDNEGRITALEFKKFNIVTVYTPNSQRLDSDRNYYRTRIWDFNFLRYIESLKKNKTTIICGDFNVAHKEIDVYNPQKFKNAAAGFLDDERKNFENILKLDYIDILRERNPETILYSYWDQIRPHMRKVNKGWRLDYFLIPNFLKILVCDCQIHSDIFGSDHAPISIEFFSKYKNK